MFLNHHGTVVFSSPSSRSPDRDVQQSLDCDVTLSPPFSSVPSRSSGFSRRCSTKGSRHQRISYKYQIFSLQGMVIRPLVAPNTKDLCMAAGPSKGRTVTISADGLVDLAKSALVSHRCEATLFADREGGASVVCGRELACWKSLYKVNCGYLLFQLNYCHFYSLLCGVFCFAFFRHLCVCSTIDALLLVFCSINSSTAAPGMSVSFLPSQ